MSPTGQRAGAAHGLPQPPFLALAAALFAVFLLSRLPFFWYYPSAQLAQDTKGYLDMVDEIRSGQWPRFEFRTPGYPLFFWFVTLFTRRWIGVVYAQNLLSYASSVFLVYSARRYRPSLALPATLAMCGFLGSSQVVLYDIALLSDSLYASCLISAVALLILAFRDLRPVPLAMASAAMALCIYVRPAGQYFIVIYAAIAAFLVLRRRPAASVAAFLAPFAALVLGLCAYNLATISSFTVSSFGEANLVGTTALFWETDPRLPDSVNAALKDLPASYARQDITADDLQAVRTSWDVERLNLIYEKAFNRLIFSEGWGWGRLGAGSYLKSRENIRAVSMIAIRRHPLLYAKFVWVGLVEFYEAVGYTFDIESSLAYRQKGNPLWGMGGSHPDEAAALLAGARGGAAPAVTPVEKAPAPERFVRGLQHLWQRLHAAVYQHTAWALAYFVVLVLAAVRLAQTRARDPGVFLLFMLTLIPLGAGLLTALIVISADRYSYPTQFIYYLCVALSPLLWARAPMPDARGPAA